MVHQSLATNNIRLRKLVLYYALPVLTETCIERLELYIQGVRDEIERLNNKQKNEIFTDKSITRQII